MDIFEWDESIPVTANNLNEMQNIINNNISQEVLDVYSTSEQRIGTWVGKPLYRKLYYVSAFPNNTTTSFAHNLYNVNFVKIDGIATDEATLWLNANVGSSSGRMTITANATTVFLYANSNRSSLHGYVILEYTKTTD